MQADIFGEQIYGGQKIKGTTPAFQAQFPFSFERLCPTTSLPELKDYNFSL